MRVDFAKRIVESRVFSPYSEAVHVHLMTHMEYSSSITDTQKTISLFPKYFGGKESTIFIFSLAKKNTKNNKG